MIKEYTLQIILIILLVILNTMLGITGLMHSKIREKVDDGFNLVGNENVTILYGEEYVDKGYSLNIDDTNNVEVTTTNNIDSTRIGNYELIYTLNYKNYTKSLVRHISIVDSIAPNIEIKCDDEINIALNSKVDKCLYELSDNYDTSDNIRVEEISNVDTSKVGDYEYLIRVMDSSNNVNEKKIIVHVKEKNELNYIVISISKQKLDYYENGKVYMTTPITSGKYNKTPKGNFKVYNKVRNTTLKGKNYSSFVKYWIGFVGNSIGMHDASWRNNFGTKDYYYTGSHGCVNMPLDAIVKIYDRVEVGMPVYVVN